MKYKFFEKVYDDEGDSKARNFFQAVKGWLKKLRDPMSIRQIKNTFFANRFSETCLVESGAGDQLLLESVGEIREVFGADKRSEPGLTHQEDLKEAFGSNSVKKGSHTQDLKEAFGAAEKKDKALTHQEELKEAFGKTAGQTQTGQTQKVKNPAREIREAFGPEKVAPEGGLTADELEFLTEYGWLDAYHRQEKAFLV